MSKELRALNELKNISCYMYGEYIGESFEVYKDELNIIETALKQAQKDKKELEELKKAISNGTIQMLWANMNSKELKAFEIIKSKEMLSVFKDIGGKFFIAFNTTAVEISQEQYEILREVLL